QHVRRPARRPSWTPPLLSRDSPTPVQDQRAVSEPGGEFLVLRRRRSRGPGGGGCARTAHHRVGRASKGDVFERREVRGLESTRHRAPTPWPLQAAPPASICSAHPSAPKPTASSFSHKSWSS